MPEVEHSLWGLLRFERETEEERITLLRASMQASKELVFEHGVSHRILLPPEAMRSFRVFEALSNELMRTKLRSEVYFRGKRVKFFDFLEGQLTDPDIALNRFMLADGNPLAARMVLLSVKQKA